MRNTATFPGRFFTFTQNNSGGYFTEPASYVIVEANNAKHANQRAVEDIDLYFDGVNAGRDCSCCGDRWSGQYDDKDGSDEPEIYGDHPTKILESDRSFSKSLRGGKTPFCKIYYLDGNIETIN